MGNEASAELPPGRAAAAAAGPRGPAAPPDLDLSSLSEAERAKILSVMARAQDLEEAAPTPPPQRERCPLCGNSDLELACRCVDCGRAACARCGSALPQPDGKRPWVCMECQSKFRQSQEARRQDGFRQTPAAMSQAPPPAAAAQQSPRAAAGVQQFATSQSAQRASGMQRAMQPAVVQPAPMQPAATQPAATQPVASQPAVQQFTTPQMTATSEPRRSPLSRSSSTSSTSSSRQQQRATTVQSTSVQQQQQRAVVQQHMDAQPAAAAQQPAATSGAQAEEAAQTEADEQEAERRRIQREELERHRREQEEQRQAEISQAEQERRLERMQQEQQRRLQALASRPPPPPVEEEESDEEELPAEVNEPNAEPAEQEAAEDKLANSTGGIPRTVPLPGRADWSPVSDLSPILDVSPSLEAAEQELMAQFHEERRMPRATSGTISGMLADFNKALSLASPPRTPRRLPEPSPPVPAPRCLSAAAAPCSPSVTPEPAESPASSEPDAKVRRRLPPLPRDQEPVPARRAKDRARVLSAPERPNRPQPPPRACSVDGGLAASSGGAGGMSGISTVGSVGLANTVSTASSAAGAVGSLGSLGALGTLGSVGTVGSMGTVNTLGTAIGTVGSMGTVNAMGTVGGTMGSVGNMGTMGTVGTVGTVGSRLPSYMNSLKQQLREELRSVTDERRRLLELRDRDMRSEGDLAALLGWSGRRRTTAADQSWATTAEPRRSAASGPDPWRTRRRGDKSRKPRSWHPSPYGSEDEDDSCEQRKASIKAEIAKRRQQIEENARLHAELYKLARLRQADSGVSPDLGIVTSGGGGSVLEAIDQVLRQERRRWPAASSAPNDESMVGMMHCGASAEDRSMALIASTFPDSPMSSEDEEEPPAMPLLPDMPRRRRLHHMMQQEPELDLVGGGGGNARRVLLTRDPRRGGLGVRVVGGKRMSNGQLGAYVARVGRPDTLGQLSEGDRVLEWNGVPLTGKTYEQVQRVMDTHNTGDEVELLVQSDWDSFDSPVPTQRRRQHGRRTRFEWSPPNEWPQSTAEMLQASPPTASLRPYRMASSVAQHQQQQQPRRRRGPDPLAGRRKVQVP
ncbi:hypothetical protein V5799_002594 [Amblyomma americanum]|uniref:PDZ domain-containing protein n=1 Tax=Amblyomma americanum TaxID=6943 RepID=A0AAQ4CWW1_AMBAM